MNEPNETIEIFGPANGGWYRTQIPDWIALCPDLKDGAYRLYCILRALILEKQKNKIRVLSHEQIAFLAVGKNGKPASISTIKALLANLQEVGLVSNPDGSRIVTSSGPGTIQSRRRYQLADWPQAPNEYTGWRNAFDKLDAFTDDWRTSRTDVPRGPIRSQKSGPRDDQHGNTPDAGQLEGQKSDGHGQKSDFDSQKSGENPASTSEDTPFLKESPEGVASTSSSSVTGEDTTPTTGAQEKKTSKTPEDIVMQRTHCTPDEARMVVDYIEQQGDGRGGRIRSLAWWVTNREERTLLSDLAHIRRHSAAPTITHCGIHQAEMKPYGCDACAAEIKAGDRDQAAAHLALVGEKARPDLARLLEALVTPVDNVRSLDEGERIRRMQRKPYGVVGGSRDPLPPHSEYQRLAGMTSDQIGAEML